MDTDSLKKIATEVFGDIRLSPQMNSNGYSWCAVQESIGKENRKDKIDLNRKMLGNRAGGAPAKQEGSTLST